MLIITKFIREVLKILQADISPNQIAFGFALGLFLGLVPGLVLKCMFFLLIMILRVNVGAVFLGAAIFAVFNFFVDPISDRIGFYILNIDVALPFYTFLYDMPIIPFTKFNNTVVMGNFVLSLVLFVPVVFLSKKFILHYRKHCREKVAKWRIVKIFTAGYFAKKFLG
jgi:uncharacterized protein (TIGR03546 family)